MTPATLPTPEAPFPGIPLHKNDEEVVVGRKDNNKKGKKKEKEKESKDKKKKKKDKKKPATAIKDEGPDKENKELKSPPRIKETPSKDGNKINDDKRKRFMQLKDYQLKDLRDSEGDDVLEVLLSSNKFSQGKLAAVTDLLVPSSTPTLESTSTSEKDSDDDVGDIAEDEHEISEQDFGAVFSPLTRLDLSPIEASHVKSCLGAYLLGRWRKHSSMMAQ